MVMADIVDFRDKYGGGGPADPTLQQRVAQLEKDVSRNTAILERLEPMIIAIHSSCAKQADVFAVKADVARIDGRIDGIEKRIDAVDKRFSMIPTTWQVISIIAMLLMGIAGIVFTAGRFLRP